MKASELMEGDIVVIGDYDFRVAYNVKFPDLPVYSISFVCTRDDKQGLNHTWALSGSEIFKVIHTEWSSYHD